jgi:predicted DNA-binding WGR domain protein
MTKVKAEKSAKFTDYEVPVGWIVELNFFDMTGEKAGTHGTSAKMYHLEVQVSKDGKLYQLYSEYGPTGKVAARDWRYFAEDREAAEAEFNSIKKSKLKKGYVEIDVAQRTLGSEEAKKQVKAVVLKNAEVSEDVVKKPILHSETARLISTLMGATNNWVIQTLKCPLGQLTNDQVNRGRQCLVAAKQILSTSHDKKELLALTNQFYGLIPHNLGAGARGQMAHLLLDSVEKIDQKEYDLDTLLDAKVIGATLTSDSTYDQYKSLDTEFIFMDHSDTRFGWLNKLIQDTRAHNHNHLGKIILLNAWDVQRNGERNTFLSRAQQIAGQCGRQVIPDQMSIVTKRTDVYDPKLFEAANIIPLFHGTRSQNITGIIKQGMLIRPSGVVICGAMYGHSLYFGKSSKSINYTNIKSSYWAGGNDDRAFLFVVDCALGNQKIATGPGNYSRENIKPNHSVWARGGSSGVINDEFMLYDTNQHNIRYLLEFTCQQK